MRHQRISQGLYLIPIVFPLISAPGAYLILKFSDTALIGGYRLFQSHRNYSQEISKNCNFLFPNKNK